MRGHDHLVAMRRRGQRPLAACFDLDHDPLRGWRDWFETSRFAQIEVQPTDRIGLLDLRFVVGMWAFVQGSDAARVRQLHDALKAAGAAVVMSAVYRETEAGELVAVEEFDSVEGA